MATSQMATNERTNPVVKATTTEGDNHVNTNAQTAVIQESKMQITGSKLIRWAAIPAMLAGIYYAAIQPIHPTDALSSVNTTAWAIITPLKVVMCLFFMLGRTGLYARQVNKVGWLGLAGYLVSSHSWAVNLV